MKNFLLGFVLVSFMSLCGTAANIRASDILVGVRVATSHQVSLDRIDHSRWDALLKKYVDSHGLVNYAVWKANAADLRVLDDYLKHLSQSNGHGGTEQKLSFWINAYNAVTVKGILLEYPTSSIRNHTARLIGYNIWKNLKLLVNNQPVSLDEMEHQILRKMNEPRIHFAIVCASMGCPRLLDEAYTPVRLEEQLTLNSRAFFADPSKFRYDANGHQFFVSPILDWFGKDFGDNSSAQLKCIAPWISDRAASQAAASGAGSISFVEYDWGLNDQK